MKTFVAATLAVVLAMMGLASAREPAAGGHASPELKAWIQKQLKAGRSPEWVKLEVAQMGQRGMRRLDLAGLATRTRLFLRLMEHAASVRDCAAIARGGSPAAVQSAMSRISEADHGALRGCPAAAPR